MSTITFLANPVEFTLVPEKYKEDDSKRPTAEFTVAIKRDWQQDLNYWWASDNRDPDLINDSDSKHLAPVRQAYDVTDGTQDPDLHNTGQRYQTQEQELSNPERAKYISQETVKDVAWYLLASAGFYGEVTGITGDDWVDTNSSDAYTVSEGTDGTNKVSIQFKSIIQAIVNNFNLSESSITNVNRFTVDQDKVDTDLQKRNSIDDSIWTLAKGTGPTTPGDGTDVSMISDSRYATGDDVIANATARDIIPTGSFNQGENSDRIQYSTTRLSMLITANSFRPILERFVIGGAFVVGGNKDTSVSGETTYSYDGFDNQARTITIEASGKIKFSQKFPNPLYNGGNNGQDEFTTKTSDAVLKPTIKLSSGDNAKYTFVNETDDEVKVTVGGVTSITLAATGNAGDTSEDNVFTDGAVVNITDNNDDDLLASTVTVGKETRKFDVFPDGGDNYDSNKGLFDGNSELVFPVIVRVGDSVDSNSYKINIRISNEDTTLSDTTSGNGDQSGGGNKE